MATKQHERREAHDDANRWRRVARRAGFRSRVTFGDDVEIGVGARIRMLRGQRVGKDIELGGRLAEPHAGPQASGHRERLLEPVGQQVRPPRFDERARGGGDEKLRRHEAVGPDEVLRHDPDDGHVRRPEAHDLSDDSRIPAEPRPPGVMGQDNERRIAGTARFPGEERATAHGVQLQNVEVVVADVLDLDPLRRATVDRQQLFRRGVRGQTFEDVVALCQTPWSLVCRKLVKMESEWYVTIVNSALLAGRGHVVYDREVQEVGSIHKENLASLGRIEFLCQPVLSLFRDFTPGDDDHVVDKALLVDVGIKDGVTKHHGDLSVDFGNIGIARPRGGVELRPLHLKPEVELGVCAAEKQMRQL